MERTLKTILIVIIIALAALVAARKFLFHAGGAATEDPVAEEQQPGPFDGMGIRFDGHYRHEVGQLRYLMRFFPEGRVVTINGTKDVDATLHQFLRRDTEGNQSMGLHNVLAQVRGDSIFFITRPMKGEISHRGRVTSDSTVRFLRHSHITGKDFDFTFVFRSDERMKVLEQQAQQVGEAADTVSGQ
jgi:hypothetical protein